MEGTGDKGKVVVVMGATATGKSKLAIDLAMLFDGEVINSDKIQVYDGLDIVTNKVSEEERAGVPHHLIGGVHQDADYDIEDFRRDATRAVKSVLARGRLPIIAGGSNRYLEALLDSEPGFRQQHELCFLWVDSHLPVLHRYVRHRVDRMMELGLVDEVRELFRLDADYSRGIRRSIGVPEMDTYFRQEATGALLNGDNDALLASAIGEIKANTCRLARRQLQKIHRLRGLPGWSLRRFDVTRVLELKVQISASKDTKEEECAAWEADVVVPATRVVEMFLLGGNVVNSGRDEQPVIVPMDVAVPGAGATAETWCGMRLLETTASRPDRGVFHGMEAAAAV